MANLLQATTALKTLRKDVLAGQVSQVLRLKERFAALTGLPAEELELFTGVDGPFEQVADLRKAAESGLKVHIGHCKAGHETFYASENNPLERNRRAVAHGLDWQNVICFNILLIPVCYAIHPSNGTQNVCEGFEKQEYRAGKKLIAAIMLAFLEEQVLRGEGDGAGDGAGDGRPGQQPRVFVEGRALSGILFGTGPKSGKCSLRRSAGARQFNTFEPDTHALTGTYPWLVFTSHHSGAFFARFASKSGRRDMFLQYALAYREFLKQQDEEEEDEAEREGSEEDEEGNEESTDSPVVRMVERLRVALQQQDTVSVLRKLFQRFKSGLDVLRSSNDPFDHVRRTLIGQASGISKRKMTAAIQRGGPLARKQRQWKKRRGNGGRACAVLCCAVAVLCWGWPVGACVRLLCPVGRGRAGRRRGCCCVLSVSCGQ
jgi:hypothetical protein